jgi:hypothetical protein
VEGLKKISLAGSVSLNRQEKLIGKESCWEYFYRSPYDSLFENAKRHILLFSAQLVEAQQKRGLL